MENKIEKSIFIKKILYFLINNIKKKSSLKIISILLFETIPFSSKKL